MPRRGGAEIIVLNVEAADDDPLRARACVSERELLMVAQQ